MFWCDFEDSTDNISIDDFWHQFHILFLRSVIPSTIAVITPTRLAVQQTQPHRQVLVRLTSLLTQIPVWRINSPATTGDAFQNHMFATDSPIVRMAKTKLIVQNRFAAKINSDAEATDYVWIAPSTAMVRWISTKFFDIFYSSKSFN